MAPLQNCRHYPIHIIVLLLIGTVVAVQAQAPAKADVETQVSTQSRVSSHMRTQDTGHAHDLLTGRNNRLDFPLTLGTASGNEDRADNVIHFTDYLYSLPEIREPYEAYLRMKRESPAELEAMQIAVTHAVGDTLSFQVYNIGESEPGDPVYDRILFELRATGEQSEIWVEREEYQPGKIDDSVVDAMMESLEERTPSQSVNPDQGIILNNIDFFAQGNPDLVPDPDGSGVVKLLVLDIRDDWDPGEGGGFTAGFFNPADLSPRTSNRFSNQAAILYVDSFPGIYEDDRPADPNRPLSVIAHEFQHLIHSGRGNLITFMDEGQSEVAEVWNGFDARSMIFLNEPDEVSGNVESQSADGILRWRRGEQRVLRDYQRAQLFHGYLHERIGEESVGRLTQSGPGNPWVQYQNVINHSGTGLTFREVLTDFYVANWVNDTDWEDGRYGYAQPQFVSVRSSTPGRRFDAEERPWVRNEQVSLQYGGAQYTQWRHVQDLSLSLGSPQEISHFVIAEEENGAGPEIIEMNGSELMLQGMYSSVVLVSVNTLVESSTNFGSRQFVYSAQWTPSEVRVVDINYSVNPVAGYVPFPLIHSENTVFRGLAVRVSPTIEGVLQGVDFSLWHTGEAIEGSGTLRVNVTESRLSSGTGADVINVPSDVIAYTDIDFEDLNPGSNSVDFSHADIEMEPDRNYHVFFRIMDESEDASLLFTFDQGSDEKDDTNYYPVRTILAGYNQAGELSGWSRLLGSEDNDNDNDNKNLVMTARILSRVPVEEAPPEVPVSDQFELLYNYPNPFNNETLVHFNVPSSVEEGVRVTIEIYDILGRRVGILMDETRQAGAQDVMFRAGELSSGIYILRMRAGGSADSHKLMLLK